MKTERLKKLRNEAGLTQTEFAAIFGFSNQRYNFYETGKREPDHETLIKFANYFKVTVDYLLGISDNPRPYKNHHYYIEDDRTYCRQYSETDGQTRTYLMNDDGTQTLIEEAPAVLETAEALRIYAEGKKGGPLTQEELNRLDTIIDTIINGIGNEVNT